ncbi:hypothetical protein Y032_0149g2718 [Ancylostoma ceylanicum]|uniref:PPM-type phosphatase domain-containing protein n=1 Tax=Ancylostoma ceylanicum TaxID=53326 RepID=A0A016T0W4_9BILA|nr:hypothetical protein Y032_0149g2718 [Ancylostoma ceylanicum]
MTPKFLILACDGLWKAFGNEEAIKYVHELLGKAVKRRLSAVDLSPDAPLRLPWMNLLTPAPTMTEFAVC